MDGVPQGFALADGPTPMTQHFTSLGSLGHPPEMYEPPLELHVEVWMQMPFWAYGDGAEPLQWPFRAAMAVRGKRARREREGIVGESKGGWGCSEV